MNWLAIHAIYRYEMMRFFRNYESKFSDKDGVYATWTFCRVELRIA